MRMLNTDLKYDPKVRIIIEIDSDDPGLLAIIEQKVFDLADELPDAITFGFTDGEGNSFHMPSYNKGTGETK